MPELVTHFAFEIFSSFIGSVIGSGHLSNARPHFAKSAAPSAYPLLSGSSARPSCSARSPMRTRCCQSKRRLNCYIRDGFGRLSAFLSWCLFLYCQRLRRRLGARLSEYLARVLRFLRRATIAAVVMIVSALPSRLGTRKGSTSELDHPRQDGHHRHPQRLTASLGHLWPPHPYGFGTTRHGLGLWSNFGLP